jgi:hypothetical protein
MQLMRMLVLREEGSREINVGRGRGWIGIEGKRREEG